VQGDHAFQTVPHQKQLKDISRQFENNPFSGSFPPDSLEVNHWLR
jgi:hypothetical protein